MAEKIIMVAKSQNLSLGEALTCVIENSLKFKPQTKWRQNQPY
jgi:hypothetical protein